MTAVPRAVVDASVALKWQLDDEEDIEAALALRNDFIVNDRIDLCAPTLFNYELANGVRSAARRARLDPERARLALRNLLDAGVETQEPDMERVLSLALEHNVTTYDAAYVAVAEVLGCELWTADGPLYKAFSEAHARVRWIAEYPAPA